VQSIRKVSFLCVAGAVRRSGAGIRRCQCRPAAGAGHCAGKGALQPVAQLSAQVPRADPRSRRCRQPAPPLRARHSSDLAAGAGRRGPLHYLPPGPEGSQSCRREHSSLSASTPSFRTRWMDSDASSVMAARDRPPRLPRRTTASARRRTDSAHALHRIRLRPVPPECADRNAAAQPGQNHAYALRLRSLPRHHAPRRLEDEATDHPPSLAHIADKTTREWIFSWLKDPQAYAASTTMPNYKLSDADASDISAYLVSSSTPQAGDTARRRQARGRCRSRRGTEPLRRIVLRLLPRGSECGGQPGGRRSGSRN
jgi:hypothetical protein